MEKQNLITDEELFREWLSGKEESFRILMERYEGKLLGIIFSWTRDKKVAEDIFQETWLRIIAHREDFDLKKKFSSWLFQIALNLVRDHFRRAKRWRMEGDGSQLDWLADPETPEAVVWEKEKQEKLERAFSELSEQEREVFILRHFGGMSFLEISELLQLNLNTTLSRMHQAVNRLKKLLGEKQ